MTTDTKLDRLVRRLYRVAAANHDSFKVAIGVWPSLRPAQKKGMYVEIRVTSTSYMTTCPLFLAVQAKTLDDAIEKSDVFIPACCKPWGYRAVV